jgi:ELWxxDGT repeat protein
MGSTLFFVATHSIFGRELFKTDGTTSGTVLVKEIWSGAQTSNFPKSLAVVSNTLFFSAGTTNGYELWKSDGTTAGTSELKDVYPGSTASSPSDLINANGTLYFVAASPSVGRELWKSDGTNVGTVLVADNIRPGSSSSSIFELTVANNVLFFQADDFTTYGRELWTVNLAGGTGIPQLASAKDKVNVYPNPSNGIFTIKTDTEEETNVKIYNAMGTLIFEKNNHDQNTVIDIHDQPAGYYLLEVSSGNKTFTSKPIIINN